MKLTDTSGKKPRGFPRKRLPRILLRAGGALPYYNALFCESDRGDMHTLEGRPDWDSYGLILATAAGTRGDCRRSLVGAVLMDNRSHHILATSYNGTDPGVPGCLEGACPRGLLTYDQLAAGGTYANCIAYHAEFNLMERFTDRYPLGAWMDHSEHTTAYITRAPCTDCTQLLDDHCIGRVVWPGGSLW